MNKVEELKKQIKDLKEKQLQLITELRDVCPHNKASLNSVSHHSGGFDECNFEWETGAGDEYTLTCLDCGMVIVSDNPRFAHLNTGQIVDNPLQTEPDITEKRDAKEALDLLSKQLTRLQKGIDNPHAVFKKLGEHHYTVELKV